MKKKSFNYLLFFFAFIAFSACTLTKRTYRPGYHISWHHEKNGSVELENEKESVIHSGQNTLAQTADIVDHVSSLSFTSQIMDTEVETVNTPENLVENKQPIQRVDRGLITKNKDLLNCDTLYFLNGDVLIVTIVSEGKNEILYTNCGQANGSKRFARMSEVQSITYSDGRVKEINEPKENSQNNGAGGGSRNFLVSLVLLLLLGTIGVHRFYLGYYLLGLLYIFTFGFCGIAILVDLILLLTGNLQPKNGSFDND